MKILELMSFERKKMFQRKSFWISIFAVLAVLLFSGCVMVIGKVYVNNKYACTQYELVQIQKEAGKTMKGMEITEEKLTEAKLLWEEREALMNSSPDMSPTEFLEMQKKYMPTRLLIDLVYSNMEEMNNTDYYTARKGKMVQQWKDMGLSKSEQNYLEKEDRKTNLPWTYAYNEAYARFEALQMSTMLLVSLMIVICIAPLFADEYTSHVDALLLSSKYGRGKVFAAKLLMGGLTAVVLTVAGFSVVLIEQIIIYGGGDLWAPLQVMPNLTDYPFSFTTGGLIAVTYGCSVAASLAVTAVVILCSACMKSSFGPVIVGVIVTMIPIFSGSVPESMRSLYMAVQAMPGNFVNTGTFLSQYLLGGGDFLMPAYQYVPIMYCILGAALAVFAAKGYFNRQP